MRRIPLTLVTATVLSGCTGHRKVDVTAPSPRESQGPTALSAGVVGRIVNSRSYSDDRMLVRRAALEMETDNVAVVPARVNAMAIKFGGYVQNTRETEKRYVWVTLRVPSPSLDVALDSLSTLGKVTTRTASADDVTAEVGDADARLKSLIAVRDRLRSHLDRSNTVADVVAVERELSRVQGEVDVLEGRLKVLRSQVALAEISLAASQRRVLGPLGVFFVGVGNLIGKLFVIR
jgi:hypothetical protein